MKKVAILMLCAAAIFSLAGCKRAGKAGETAVSKKASGKAVRIGVIQLVEHAALDANYKGFVDGLA